MIFTAGRVRMTVFHIMLFFPSSLLIRDRSLDQSFPSQTSPLVATLQIIAPTEQCLVISPLDAATWVCFNSLWPRDAIWLHRSRTVLGQVMACCLMAPSHNLNQCYNIINWTPRTYFSEILFTIQTFSFKKIHLKMLSAIWQAFVIASKVL